MSRKVNNVMLNGVQEPCMFDKVKRIQFNWHLFVISSDPPRRSRRITGKWILPLAHVLSLALHH